MPRNVGLIVGFVLITHAGSGCVIPVPPPEEKPFREATGEWLTRGESTVDNVNDKLGEPTLKGTGWFLYRKPHEGWGLAFCAGGGFGGFGCEALPGKTSGQFLLVEFDDKQVVTDFEILTERALCEDRQICYSGEFLMRPDTAAQDSESKKFPIPSSGCSVYTYSQTDSDLAAGELIINGVNKGGLVGKSGFYRHSVRRGSHQWMIAPSQSKTLPLPAATHVLDCQGQEIVFLRYTYGLGTFWFNKIETVDMARGRKEVTERWLAVSAKQ